MMKLGGESLEYWINDGLMTIFFFINWFRIRRIYKGELSNIKDALLPIFAALEMLVPAGLYLMLNYGLLRKLEQVCLWQLILLCIEFFLLGNRGATFFKNILNSISGNR
jgi:Na+/H+ antiporter NhaA